MPIAFLLIVLDVTLVVHAANTGRLRPWAFIILLVPVVGALAYIVAALIPDLVGSPDGQRMRNRIANKLHPEKLYCQLADQVAIADTVANRSALAAECLALGKFNEAEWHYDNILARPMGDEPIYAFGKAKAQFGCDRFQETVATLDDLRMRWPDFQSADAHLLYARATEQAGRTDEALEEYRALSEYYPGLEAKVRYAQLLRQVGRGVEARALMEGLLTQMRRSPKYVRRVQAEWISVAEKMIRT